MDLHQGSLAVTSDGIGKGSTFTITLPLKPKQVHTARISSTLSNIPQPNFGDAVRSSLFQSTTKVNSCCSGVYALFNRMRQCLGTTFAFRRSRLTLPISVSPDPMSFREKILSDVAEEEVELEERHEGSYNHGMECGRVVTSPLRHGVSYSRPDEGGMTSRSDREHVSSRRSQRQGGLEGELGREYSISIRPRGSEDVVEEKRSGDVDPTHSRNNSRSSEQEKSRSGKFNNSNSATQLLMAKKTNSGNQLLMLVKRKNSNCTSIPADSMLPPRAAMVSEIDMKIVEEEQEQDSVSSEAGESGFDEEEVVDLILDGNSRHDKKRVNGPPLNEGEPLFPYSVPSSPSSPFSFHPSSRSRKSSFKPQGRLSHDTDDVGASAGAGLGSSRGGSPRTSAVMGNDIGLRRINESYPMREVNEVGGAVHFHSGSFRHSRTKSHHRQPSSGSQLDEDKMYANDSSVHNRMVGANKSAQSRTVSRTPSAMGILDSEVIVTVHNPSGGSGHSAPAVSGNGGNCHICNGNDGDDRVRTALGLRRPSVYTFSADRGASLVVVSGAAQVPASRRGSVVDDGEGLVVGQGRGAGHGSGSASGNISGSRSRASLLFNPTNSSRMSTTRLSSILGGSTIPSGATLLSDVKRELERNGMVAAGLSSQRDSVASGMVSVRNSSSRSGKIAEIGTSIRLSKVGVDGVMVGGDGIDGSMSGAVDNSSAADQNGSGVSNAVKNHVLDADMSGGTLVTVDARIDMDRSGTGNITADIVAEQFADGGASAVVESKTEGAVEVNAPERKTRALVVDDAHSNRKMLSRMMRKRYDIIDEAEDGLQAVECVRRSIAEGFSYDIIFMDFVMPRMDGPAAAKEIRKLGYQGYLFAVTGNILCRDVERFKTCGADTVLSKPFDVERFDEQLKSFKEVRRASALT